MSEVVDAGYAELVSLYVLLEHWCCGAGETLWQAAAAKMCSAAIGREAIREVRYTRQL